MWSATAVSGKESYGLGFQVLEGGRFVMHGGGQPGTSTLLSSCRRRAARWR
jgi:hypothetical protein